MKSRFACTHCSISSKPSTVRRALQSAVLGIGALWILAACEASIPFNVLILPFVPLETRSGLHEPDLGPLEVDALATILPVFSMEQIPLNTVRILIEPGPALDADSVVTASVELTIEIGIQPDQTGLSCELLTNVSIYLAPDTAVDRFASQYRIDLGSAGIGLSSGIDLGGELSAEQIDFLRSGSLLAGLELRDTRATVTNSGDQAFVFEGFRWELTEFRIRGTVRL